MSLIIFERLRQSGELINDWKKGNIIPILKKGRKEGPGNYKSVSVTSMPGKVMEQIFLEIMLSHKDNGEVIGA